MQICKNTINSFCFKSTSYNKEDAPYSDCPKDNRSSMSDHYYNEKLPYQSIYEEEGRMTDYQFGNFINGLGKQPANPSYDNILSLPLRNIKQIPNTNNSYRGQTLVAAKNECLKTMKNSGIKTIIDIIGYQGYEEKVRNAGLDFYQFKTKNIWNSSACDSLKKYQKKQECFFNGMKEDGFDIDVEESLEYTKNKFLTATREPIEQIINFINIMQNDNIYISCEYGTHETDEALFINEAFNPKLADEAVTAPTVEIITKLFNIYYNLTPEDKERMGWTKETNDKFMDRLAERQIEIMSNK